MTAPIDTDALVIGAGPVGLFQAFQLGLLGVRFEMVDALPHIGGQCVELYPDKPIYDIPGTPICTGRELIGQLMAQLQPFAPRLQLDQQVIRIEVQADGHWLVESDEGTRWHCKAILIAAGVGAFVPRQLPLEGLSALMGQCAWHAHARPEGMNWAGQQVLVTGEGDLAVQCALELLDAGARVTLMHRRSQLSASAELQILWQQALTQGRVRFLTGQPIGLQADGLELQALHYLDPEGQAQSVPATQLVMALGLSPRLGPIADWGLAMARKQIQVDPASFATSVPGIYAVGDINHYPGKKKLILCGFHEATLAAYDVLERLRPDEPHPLQYTTTSSQLHKRLGVA